MAEDFPHGKGSWMSDMSSIRGGMWERKLWMAKVLFLPSLSLSLSPFSSSFRSWLRVQDAGEAEKAKQNEGKWPGEPKTSPFFFIFIHRDGRIRSHGPNLPP